jgi:hypothetical protein
LSAFSIVTLAKFSSVFFKKIVIPLRTIRLLPMNRHRKRNLLSPAFAKASAFTGLTADGTAGRPALSTSVWRRGRWNDGRGFMSSMREIILRGNFSPPRGRRDRALQEESFVKSGALDAGGSTAKEGGRAPAAPRGATAGPAFQAVHSQQPAHAPEFCRRPALPGRPAPNGRKPGVGIRR